MTSTRASCPCAVMSPNPTVVTGKREIEGVGASGQAFELSGTLLVEDVEPEREQHCGQGEKHHEGVDVLGAAAQLSSDLLDDSPGQGGDADERHQHRDRDPTCRLVRADRDHVEDDQDPDDAQQQPHPGSSGSSRTRRLTAVPSRPVVAGCCGGRAARASRRVRWCSWSAPRISGSTPSSRCVGASSSPRSCQPPRPPWDPTRLSKAATSSVAGSTVLLT